MAASPTSPVKDEAGMVELIPVDACSSLSQDVMSSPSYNRNPCYSVSAQCRTHLSSPAQQISLAIPDNSVNSVRCLHVTKRDVRVRVFSMVSRKLMNYGHDTSIMLILIVGFLKLATCHVPFAQS